MVISLVYAALGPGVKRAAVRRLLGLGVLVFAALSLYFTWNPVLGLWMAEARPGEPGFSGECC